MYDTKLVHFKENSGPRYIILMYFIGSLKIIRYTEL